MAPLQISVFTGFLGAGKTSIILSLLPQLPKDYKVVLLKNEFGDVEVDSQLARQSSLSAVSEFTNGCVCCVLIGRLKHALLEIQQTYNPDRIIIETSGSAFPAPLVLQIRELARETDGAFALDCVVTVVDCENFRGYEDSSPTARMQAGFSDVILLNKWENISEESLDRVLDEVHTLNDETPKIRTNGRNGVDPSLIFNLDSKLASTAVSDTQLTAANGDAGKHNDEVGVVSVWQGSRLTRHEHEHGDACDQCLASSASPAPATSTTRRKLESALAGMPKDSVYRVKGFLRLSAEADDAPPTVFILNWAFGRFELTALASDAPQQQLPDDSNVRLTVMGHPSEVKRYGQRLAAALDAQWA